MPSSATDRNKLALDMRVTARHLFEHALAEASIDRAFQRHVECDKGVLRIGEDLHDLDSYNRVLVISIGKAAHAMVNSLEMQAGSRFAGIVAGPLDPVSQVRGFRYFRGGHPMPNQESIRAAEAILKSLGAQDASSLVIYLLSGGGSSIAEKPIDGQISLPDLVATYRVLVQDALASGPTMPDSTSVAVCYAVAEKYGMIEQFPDSVRQLFQCHALEETPKPDDVVFHRSRWWPLLSNASLLEAAEVEAQRHGFSVEIDNTCDDWDYMRAADYLLERLRRLRKKSERACLISGGEVTVKVENGGTGGRNQQFVLACAPKISCETITVLSAGTDGIDGNSPAAGAIVDGSTLERARVRGLDPGTHLAGFNAYPFFQSLGDAITTGSTGNNLRDLRVLLAY